MGTFNFMSPEAIQDLSGFYYIELIIRNQTANRTMPIAHLEANDKLHQLTIY